MSLSKLDPRFERDVSKSIRPSLPIAAIVSVLLFALSCEKPERAPLVTVERYMSAIQQRDNQILALLWGPHRRHVAGAADEAVKALEEAFEQRVLEAHDGFDAAKESGMLPEDPLAVATFRALRLGKGAASIPLGVEIAEDGATARVRTRIVTNLDNLQLENLPLGVRVYLMGYPMGHLELMAVGYQKLEDKSLLGSVEIEWRLSRAPEGVGTVAGWLIESITPDPATAARWEPGRRGA
jgi:hypothetical protein